jgi:hypothetical protein
MKILLITFAFLIISQNVFSQRFTDQNQIKDFYLEKSKNQKTAGWILLGAGTALVIGGGYVFDKTWDDTSYTTTDIAGFAILTGVIADLVSIPYFISAGMNKRKAASFSLGYQNIYLRCDNSYCIKNTPALVINIKF